MRFGLTENALKKINSVFSSFSEIEEALLYGSLAKGNFSNSSDIDIALKGAGLTLSKILKINNKLDELSLPYTIDINLFEFIENHELTEHIQRVGQVVYKA